MRLFGWIQNKLSAKPVNKKPATVYAAANQICAKQEAREEFSDWPHGLLSIGTFGKSSSSSNENPSSSSISEEEEEIVDFSPEEVGKLQKELTKLLSRKPNKEKEIADLPLDRFLNCPSSLEVDRRVYNFSEKLELDLKIDHEDNIDKTISVIIDKCKHICAHNSNKAIGKKSISFLLKKMFVCKSGFAPTPSFRDTLLQQSRMEKILKMMLQKNMNAQNYSRPASSTSKIYLEDIKYMPKRKNNEDDDNEKRGGNDNDGCKWVKTDSEYIVLEI